MTLYRYTEHRDSARRRLLEVGPLGRPFVVSARISWDETEQVLFHRRDLRPMAAEGVSVIVQLLVTRQTITRTHLCPESAFQVMHMIVNERVDRVENQRFEIAPDSCSRR